MKKTFTLKDYTTVFISYDEPNAKENWHNLLYHVPNAIHIKNIKRIASGYRKAG